jgi:hypothetical protein
MRYQLGFTFGESGVANPGYTKDLRGLSAGNQFVFGIQGSASWGLFLQPDFHTSTESWQDTMGGLTGDGLWHCYEFHIKNGTSGVVEIWVDDAQVYSFTGNVPTDDIRSIEIGGNQNAVGDANGLSVNNSGTPTDWYTDFDDIAVSDSGRIGPLSSGVARRGSSLGGLG